MTLTAIDPGIKGLAWAHFEGMSLHSCGLSRFPKDAIVWDINLADYAQYHATQVPPADLVVIEGMFHYPPSPTQKKNAVAQIAIANDLLRLQAVGCLTAGSLSKHWRYFTASEWKGQTDKDVTRHRVTMAFEGRAFETECMAKHIRKVPSSLQHNVYDAVALGLTFLGRMKK